MYDSGRLISAYLHAKETLLADGYAEVIDWQHNVTLRNTTETEFLREATWVILSSGMKAAVIERKFPEIGQAFLQFESAACIVAHRKRCRYAALKLFAHTGKIDAIIRIASHVKRLTWPLMKIELERSGPASLTVLPYIGPITALHLAKNIGMDVSKSDRHLIRLARRVGAPDVRALCAVIAQTVGDRIGVVDLVLWRYTALYGMQSLLRADGV